jgi:hypothetical protein
VDSITNAQERHPRPLQHDNPSPLRTRPQSVQGRDAAGPRRAVLDGALSQRGMALAAGWACLIVQSMHQTAVKARTHLSIRATYLKSDLHIHNAPIPCLFGYKRVEEFRAGLARSQNQR